MGELREKLEYLFKTANIAVFACNLQGIVAPFSVREIDSSTYEVIYIYISSKIQISPIYFNDDIFYLDSNLPLAFMSELESRIMRRKEHVH